MDMADGRGIYFAAANFENSQTIMTAGGDVAVSGKNKSIKTDWPGESEERRCIMGFCGYGAIFAQ